MSKILEIIKEKKNNIGALSSYIKKRKELVEELDSNFLFFTNKNLTRPQKCWYIINGVKEEQLCLCKKHLKWMAFKTGWRETCGNTECVKEKIKRTNIEKYGVDNPMKNRKIKEKAEKTNIEKYGADNPMKNKTVSSKMVNTKTLFTDEKKNEIIEKTLKTWNKKSDEEKRRIKEKRLESWYNKPIEEREKVLKKRKKTLKERYGYEHTFLSPEIRKKIDDTNIERYGTTILYKNKKIRQKIANTYRNNKTEDLKVKINKWDCKYLHHINTNDSLTYTLYCNRSEKEFDISYSCLRLKLLKGEDISPFFNKQHGTSKSEQELFEFIKDNYTGEVLNRYKINNKTEVDIFIPSLNLAFEYNGLWWHNELYKDKNYHLNKTELCKSNNIKLIHIWEDNWLFKQDIIKSRILNLLNKSQQIYARKCVIKDINSKDARIFLEKNHLQSFISSKHYIGLYFNNELVSIMTFGKLRKSLNSKSNNEDEYELYRFCSKNNYNIIGAASKLLKYFSKKHSPTKIITYFDRCWAESTVYKKIGFEFISHTKPNYYYIIDKIYKKHRFGFRKDILIKEGFDPNKTEHEIMIDRGIYRIYDCGNEKWALSYAKNIK